MFRGNKVPWIVGAVLIVAFGIGAFFVTKKEPKPPPPQALPANARGVVLPADRQRTLVVAPCQTPLEETVSAVRAGQGVPGATELAIPKGEGERTVIVPHCQPGQGSISPEGNLPSGAYVLPDTEQLQKTEAGIQVPPGFLVRSQLILRGGASADTVVVAGCTKKGGTKGRDAVLDAGGGGSRVAVAPSC